METMTLWMILAAAFAGVAAWLLVRGPRERLSAFVADRESDRSAWLRRVLAGRPGALGLKRRALVGAVVAVVVLVVGLARAPDLGAWLVLAVGSGFAVMITTGWVETGAARRRRERLIMDLPQALSLLGAAIGAGLPLRTATRQVAAGYTGPIADDLGRVLAQIDLGRPEGEAWRELRGDPVWALVVTDLARSAESGTRLGEALRRHADFARKQRRAAIEVVARGVGVRSVLPLMACFVPAFVLIGIVPTIASALLGVFGRIG